MNVTANITGLGTGVRSYTFKAIKHNKQSVDFELIDGDVTNSFITKIVRIERFQGYSNASGIEYYLRLRNKPNWSKCDKVTGLWRTTRKGIFYGDRRDHELVQTLIIFKIAPDWQSLALIVYPRGQYPKNQVENIAHRI
jgi:hypothetical protein